MPVVTFPPPVCNPHICQAFSSPDVLNIAEDIRDKYEFYNYGHALEILHESFTEEWSELQECFRKLLLTREDILKAGGNESPIPKKFDEVLYPYGWREIRISGDLIVKKYPRQAAQRRGRKS